MRRRTSMALGVVCCAMVVTVGGCDDSSTAAKSPGPSVRTAAAAPIPAKPAPVLAPTKPVRVAPPAAPPAFADPAQAAQDVPPVSLPPPGVDGPAYFAVDDKGVFTLDASGVHKVAKSPSRLVRQMTFGPGGEAYIAGPDGIMTLGPEAATVTAPTSFEDMGGLEAFAPAKNGALWAVSHAGVGVWRKGRWTVEPTASLASRGTILRGIAVDQAGTVWVVSMNHLHVKNSDGWTTVDLRGVTDRDPNFESVQTAPRSGEAFALASTVLLSLGAPPAEGGRRLPTKVAFPQSGTTSLGMLSWADNGIGVLRTSAQTVARFTPEGKYVVYELGTDMHGTRIHAVSVDGQGRVWVATELGLSVMGPAAERVLWKSGSIPELAGRITHLMVGGAGPPLPDVGGVRRGALRGVAVLDGQPLATVAVEVCPAPRSSFQATPCEHSSVRFGGKTDGEGRFSFSDVPLGAYGVALQTAGGWRVTRAGAYGAAMREGETLDVGTLALEAVR